MTASTLAILFIWAHRHSWSIMAQETGRGGQNIIPSIAPFSVWITSKYLQSCCSNSTKCHSNLLLIEFLFALVDFLVGQMQAL